MRLDADDIDAVAARVVELLGEQTPGPSGLVDAAALARALGVDRGWVYARARQLGAVRLGDGPRARLRFDVDHAAEALARMGTPTEPPPTTPARRRRHKRAPVPAGLQLIQGRAVP